MFLRFLNNLDYLEVMTEKEFDQMTRYEEISILGAESSAEASLREYLTEHYEIDEELDVGKYIAGYAEDINITYPVGAYIYFNGEIHRVAKSIMGIKKPLNYEFWDELDHNDIAKNIEYPDYSQMGTYYVGNTVRNGGRYFRCTRTNGIGTKDIRIPSVEGWEEVDCVDWIYDDYNLGDVVFYKGKYYELVDLFEVDFSWSPDIATKNWNALEPYSEHKAYRIGEKCIYQSVIDGKYKVVEAFLNVNKTKPNIGENLIPEDPRNRTIRKHLIRLAAYELAKRISPNNISEVRLKDYEDSMLWLNRASKLQITPKIKRKMRDDGYKTSEWATTQLIKANSKYGGWGGF